MALRWLNTSESRYLGASITGAVLVLTFGIPLFMPRFRIEGRDWRGGLAGAVIGVITYASIAWVMSSRNPWTKLPIPYWIRPRYALPNIADATIPCPRHEE